MSSTSPNPSLKSFWYVCFASGAAIKFLFSCHQWMALLQGSPLKPNAAMNGPLTRQPTAYAAMDGPLTRQPTETKCYNEWLSHKAANWNQLLQWMALLQGSPLKPIAAMNGPLTRQPSEAKCGNEWPSYKAAYWNQMLQWMALSQGSPLQMLQWMALLQGCPLKPNPAMDGPVTRQPTETKCCHEWPSHKASNWNQMLQCKVFLQGCPLKPNAAMNGPNTRHPIETKCCNEWPSYKAAHWNQILQWMALLQGSPLKQNAAMASHFEGQHTETKGLKPLPCQHAHLNMFMASAIEASQQICCNIRDGNIFFIIITKNSMWHCQCWQMAALGKVSGHRLLITSHQINNFFLNV